MKNHAFVGGSSAAVAALTKLDTAVAFLADRREGVSLAPAGRQAGLAYVWRRVFLKGRGRKPELGFGGRRSARRPPSIRRLPLGGGAARRIGGFVSARGLRSGGSQSAGSRHHLEGARAIAKMRTSMGFGPRSAARFAGAGALVLFLCWQHVQATRLGYQVEAARKNARRTGARVAALRVELDSRLSPGEVASRAARLGLVPVAPDALRRLPGSRPSADGLLGRWWARRLGPLVAASRS